MQAVQIIKLAPEEWQAYKKIRLEALRNDPQAFGSSYAESIQRPDSFWQGRLAEAGDTTEKKSWLIFARLEGQIVGSIGAYLHEEDSGPADTAQIIGVYVTPAARGKGIAAALMQAILQEVSQSSSIRRLTLGANVEQAAALALYRRAGFAITGTVSARMGDGQDHELYTMEKWIRP